MTEIVSKMDSLRVSKFWAKVDKVGKSESDCWLWKSSKMSTGYGSFKFKSNLRLIRGLAHRLAFELATGRDPSGLVVRHSCDVPLCCNPAHLELGTHADNVRDRVERGRSAKRKWKKSQENCNEERQSSARVR